VCVCERERERERESVRNKERGLCLLFPLSLLGLLCCRVSERRMAKVGGVLLGCDTRIDRHSSFGSRVVVAVRVHVGS
jgi:hypothetical protein